MVKKFVTDKDFDRIMRSYIKDSRIRRIYSDPVIRRETIGNYNDILKYGKKQVFDIQKRTKKYAANHIVQISSYIDKDDHILELAAANGWASAMLRDMGFKNILVTDINPFDYTGLKGLRHFTNHKLATRIMSFEDIDLPKNSFDIVFMCASLRHSSNVAKVAQQVSDVLKKDGKWFIIGEPVRGFLDSSNKSMVDSNKEGFNDNYYYWHHYRTEIRRAGFEIEVLFPVELHKILARELKVNTASKFKRFLLSIVRGIYSIPIGMELIRRIYSLTLYLAGSHSIIVCRKIRK
jgi:SAM-dependent methyltransferase